MSEEDYVYVAKIKSTTGLKGWLQVETLTDFLEDRFAPGKQLKLVPPLPLRSEIEIAKVRWKGKNLILKLSNVNTLEEAQLLVGRYLTVSIKEAPKLPEDTFYHYQLIGLKVITTKGETLGEIKEVISNPANDVYLVKDKRQYLIPAISQVVKKVDLDNQQMIIEPLPGLLNED
jgi:16S rRNA processing protein RimM